MSTGATLHLGTRLRLSPSLLSKKMVCPAYVPSPMSSKDRFLLMGIHALTVLKVISRHLIQDYNLERIEAKVYNGRIDLIFSRKGDAEKKRRVEVKSAKQIHIYAKYQASLYWNGKDELVVSNSAADIVLPHEFIEDAIRLAEETDAFIAEHPDEAAKTYRPQEGICRICGKHGCPSKSTTSGKYSANGDPSIAGGRT